MVVHKDSTTTATNKPSSSFLQQQQYRLPSYSQNHHTTRNKGKHQTERLAKQLLQLNLPYSTPLLHPLLYSSRQRVAYDRQCQRWIKSDRFVTLGKKFGHVVPLKRKKNEDRLATSLPSLSSDHGGNSSHYQDAPHQDLQACQNFHCNSKPELVIDKEFYGEMKDNECFNHVPDGQFYHEKEIHDTSQNISCRILLKYASEIAEGSLSKGCGGNAETPSTASLPMSTSSMSRDSHTPAVKKLEKEEQFEIEALVLDDDDEDYEIHDFERYLMKKRKDVKFEVTKGEKSGQSSTLPPIKPSTTLPSWSSSTQAKRDVSKMLTMQNPKFLVAGSKDNLYYNNNQCSPFVQQKTLQVRYLRQKDVRTRTAPSIKFCRGCQQNGCYYSRCSSSANMNIRHLGGTSFRSAQESRSKKIIVTPQHPPSSFSGRKKQQLYNNSDNKFKKRTVVEDTKSDSFVDLLNNDNQDWMIISKTGRLIQRTSNKTNLRNRGQVDLTQSLPNCIPSSRRFADHLFLENSTFDENGNLVISGKPITVSDYLYSDKYLKENYSKLADNNDYQTTASLLRVEGIRKMPLPPIQNKNNGQQNGAGHDGNDGQFISEDEFRYRFSNGAPDIKKLYPGYRYGHRQFVTRKSKTNQQVEDTFSKKQQGEDTHQEKTPISNESVKSISDGQGEEVNEDLLKTPNEEMKEKPEEIETSIIKLEDTSCEQDNTQDETNNDSEANLHENKANELVASEAEETVSSIDPNSIDKYQELVIEPVDSTSDQKTASQNENDLNDDTVSLSESVGNTEGDSSVNLLLPQQQSPLDNLDAISVSIGGDGDESSGLDAIDQVDGENEDGNEFTSFNSIHQEEFVEEENEEEEADEKSSNSPVLFVGQSASKTETMEKTKSIDTQEDNGNGENSTNQSRNSILETDQSNEEEENGNESALEFDVPPIQKPIQEPLQKKHQENKKVSIFPSSSSTKEMKKKLRKQPKPSRRLDIRYQQFKAQKEKAVDEDDIEMEGRGTMLDFASKYCILSLDQLDRYEKIFNDYSMSSSSNGFDDDTIQNENDSQQRLYAEEKQKIPEELLKFVEEYEEVCYVTDTHKETILRITSKKEQLQDQLDVLKRKIGSSELTEMEHFQKQAKLTSRIYKLEKKHADIFEKQRNVQHVKNDLQDFLTAQEDFNNDFLETVHLNKNAFKRRFCKRQKSFVDTDDLPMIMRQLNMNIKSKELTFVEKLLQIPDQHSKLNLKMFSIVAAMSEKVTGLDASMKLYIDQMDLNGMERRLGKCKELYMLINEEYNKSEYDPSNDRSAENLFAELHAGGMSKQEMKYMMERLVNEGRVDFLDFAMYIPLFIKIHQKILDTPFT